MAILTNAVLKRENINGGMIFQAGYVQGNNEQSVADVRDDGVVRITCRDEDPAVLLVENAEYPGAWLKKHFSSLGKDEKLTPEIIKDAESRFGCSLEEIRQTRRTIGAMATIVFVFDRDAVESEEDRVRIAVVQRTDKGADGTVNLGAYSRFGGGVAGGYASKGSARYTGENIACATVRELLQEFHPYVRLENNELYPVDIIPQGYGQGDLRSRFLKAAYEERMRLAGRIEQNLRNEGEAVSEKRLSFQAKELSIPDLTRDVIQVIDGQEIRHTNLAVLDASRSQHNLDFNTDKIYAVRINGIRPEQFTLKDGETDQKTSALLDRIIFFGRIKDLMAANDGQPRMLHPKADPNKVPEFSLAFRPILAAGPKVAEAALRKVGPR